MFHITFMFCAIIWTMESQCQSLEKRFRRIPLSDVLIKNPTTTKSTRTALLCSGMCSRNTPVCKTFAFEKVSGSCLLFDERVYARGTILSSFPGLKYYWTYSDTCLDGYEYDATERTCIKVSQVVLSLTSWTVHQDNCDDDGGYLYIMDTPAKRSYIESVILYQGHSLGKYHVGGGDSLTEGQHVWLDGTPVNGSFWNVNQPDDYLTEDCMIIEQSNGVYVTDDDSCGNKRNYICEIPVN